MHLGKEIYLFFGKYKFYGIIGIFISSILMGIIIYKVLKISKKEQIESYDQFITQFHLNQKIQNIIQTIIQIFLLISFYIMIAGFSAYFSQEWQLSNYAGTAIIVILCYIIFMGNIERLMKVNTVLVPILMISILILIFRNADAFNLLEETTKQTSVIKAIWDAVIYTSYNSIILIPILLPLQKCLKNKYLIFITATICTFILIILAISIFGLILKVDIDINKVELPTVYVAGMMEKKYKVIYGIIILVSIYTSAISAGYGFLEKYHNNPKQYKRIVIIMSTIAFLISNLGFTTLVNLLYPIFGILGLVQIIIILKKT
ncbi:MAG: hypothetical protein J6A04_07535 [Clostridia bacterium]|nr:hypothetical protein [Clostridia bacterium]